MENHHQQTNMCKISEVTLKDLPKINELENQLNLNKTKLNFFNQTLLNENFKFIKLVLKKQIIGFLQFSLNKSDCDIISSILDLSTNWILFKKDALSGFAPK